ncbi:hypothetical protein Neosp_006425 [[Neocosmospora] mangrovei]
MDVVFGPFEQPYGVNSTTNTTKESKKPNDPSKAITIVLSVMVGLFVAALAGAAYVTYKKRAGKSKLKETHPTTAPENEHRGQSTSSVYTVKFQVVVYTCTPAAKDGS